MDVKGNRIPLVLVTFLAVMLSGGSAFGQAFTPGDLYVMNAPSTASEGDDSILKVSGGTVSYFVPPLSGMNGSREIAFSPDGSTLYVMQSHYSLGIHRVQYFNGSGAVVDTVTGFDGTLRAMTVNTDGNLYIIVSEFSGNAKLVGVDVATKVITDLLDFGTDYFIGDMDHDDAGNIYFTGWAVGGVQDAIFKISTSLTLSVLADGSDGLDSPFGLYFDSASQRLWVANSMGTVPAELYSFDLAGNGTYYADVGTLGQPNVRGLLIDPADGLPLAPLGEYDKVVKVAGSGALTDVVTDSVHWPVDLDYVPGGVAPPWGAADLEASTFGAGTGTGSTVANYLAMLLVPAVAFLILGGRRRRE